MRRKVFVMAVVVAAPVALSACQVAVTPDGTQYSVSGRNGSATASASISSGGDNREFFWDGGDPTEADSTVCATFATGQGNDQQGISLRISPIIDSGGLPGIVAITVTRNIIYGAFNAFNFHVWDTASDSPQPYIQFGQTVISSLPYAPAVYPLNLCARTVTSANTAEFIVWTSGQAKPAWDSTTQGGSAVIPADAPRSARAAFSPATSCPVPP